jgi:hypothetical protein
MQISPPNSATTASAAQTAAEPSRWSQLFGDDGLSFRDVLDLVNPLQHIPIVGNLYRKLTGDTLDPALRVAGGALFGGPLGALLSVGSLVVEQGHGAEAVRPVNPEPSALAAHDQPYRGGWMVNAAITGQLPQYTASPLPFTEAVVNSVKVAAATTPEIRRGGWMVIQAYALSEAEKQIDDKV